MCFQVSFDFDMLILLLAWDTDRIQEKRILWCFYRRLTKTTKTAPVVLPLLSTYQKQQSETSSKSVTKINSALFFAVH